MLGIIPAAGSGSRIQPLGCSKELLPVGTRAGEERPKAVSEYLLERMAIAGVDRVAMVIAAEKSDLVRYYRDSGWSERIAFVLQPRPAGLCDAVFRALPWALEDEFVLMGLPDTIWYPINAFALTPRSQIHLVTFPVVAPEQFDAVRWRDDGNDQVAAVEVKRPGAPDRRIWGAITGPAGEFRRLAALWRRSGCQEAYLGDLFNHWIRQGGRLTADRSGSEYLDVGTLGGYRAAQARLMAQPAGESTPPSSTPPSLRPERIAV